MFSRRFSLRPNLKALNCAEDRAETMYQTPVRDVA